MRRGAGDLSSELLRRRPAPVDSVSKKYILVVYTIDSGAMIDLAALDGFDWDEGNREKNRVQHKVEWTEAEETFVNVPILILPDEKHSLAEKRFAVLGRTLADRKIAVVFTIRNNRIRVISARDMSKKERNLYDETFEKNT